MIQSGLICALVWILMQGTDRLLGWQTLQRPIVTATVTGFLLGDIRTTDSRNSHKDCLQRSCHNHTGSNIS